MPIEWTGLSPELLVPLDRDADEPLRTQLERGLREAIRTGRLAAGERLPSSRELARALHVSRGLVVDCFDQLQAEGYLVSRAGSATRVAPPARSPRTARRAGRRARSRRPRLDVDFLPATPELASFPRGRLGVGGARGLPGRAHRGVRVRRRAGRGAAAHRAGRLPGPGPRRAARADRIVVCNGFSQGLVLTLIALAEAGVRTVAFEDPGYDETGRVASALARVDMVPVPVDEEGVRVDALAETGARAVVLTPAHQWPTGVVLSPERRLELVRWAAERDGYVVEDDYDAEFRYDHDPVGSVQGLAPDRVVLIGTVSKSLAPTVRLGWVVAPPLWSSRSPSSSCTTTAARRVSSSWCWPGCWSRVGSTGTCAGCARSTPASATRWSRRWPSTPRPPGSPGWPPDSMPCCTCPPAPTRLRSSPSAADAGSASTG